MKVFMVLLVMVAPVMAGTILYEYFTSSSSFPPANWTVSNTGTGGSWTWSNSSPTDGSYAHGVVSLSGAGSGSATLKTLPFSLTAGVICNVCLSLRTTTTGPPTTFSWQQVLFNGTTEVAVLNFDPSSEWINTCAAFLDITTSSSNYSVGWRVNASKTGSGASSVMFDIDTLHITEDGVAVEPASLGRIKGAFH